MYATYFKTKTNRSRKCELLVALNYRVNFRIENPSGECVQQMTRSNRSRARKCHRTARRACPNAGKNRARRERQKNKGEPQKPLIMPGRGHGRGNPRRERAHVLGEHAALRSL